MKEINREHPEYQAWRETWPKYRDLYAGGEAFVRNADRYLIPRQREPLDVYSERVNRAFYENYLGSIIDWYGATLFRREPVLTYEGTDVGALFAGYVSVTPLQMDLTNYRAMEVLKSWEWKT
jgi:broad specificity polyphosphatase/5'/3'-nucleotidase SurE